MQGSIRVEYMVLKGIQEHCLASVCHTVAEFETLSGLIFFFVPQQIWSSLRVLMQFLCDIFDYYVQRISWIVATKQPL